MRVFSQYAEASHTRAYLKEFPGEICNLTVLGSTAAVSTVVQNTVAAKLK